MRNANESHVSIVKWHHEKGVWVHRGTVVATVETVKTTIEIETNNSGYFFPIYDLNSEVRVGETIAWILEKNQPDILSSSADIMAEPAAIAVFC